MKNSHTALAFRAPTLSFLVFAAIFFVAAPHAQAGRYASPSSWNEQGCETVQLPNRCASAPTVGSSCSQGCWVNTSSCSGGRASSYDWYPCVTTPAAPSVSCAANPSVGTVGQSISRTATPSGGDGTYKYTWSGTTPITGSTATIGTTYSTTGYKQGYISVQSPANPGSRYVYAFSSSEGGGECAPIVGAGSACPSSSPAGMSCTGSCYVDKSSPTCPAGRSNNYDKYSCLGNGSETASGSCPVQINEAAPVARPDLTASAPTPTSATAGTATTFSSTISNSGNASTEKAFTTLFQRATSSGGANATDIGTHSTATIPAGSSRNATFSYAFPSAGTWYMRVCADKSAGADTGTITESNEGNNCGPWTAIGIGAAGGGCVANEGNSCTSAANSCGMTNSGTINCDGSCSATTPPNSSCPSNPPPTVNLTINGQNSSSSVTQGTQSTLGWSTTNATSCTASASPANAGWNGSKATANGTTQTQTTGASLSPGTYQYTLTCSGGGGSASDTITLTIIPPDSCGNGATNPPSCTICPGGYTMTGGVCVQNQPDLTGSATGASPSSFTVGTPTTLSGTITNQGNAPANSPDRTPTFNNWFQVTPPGTQSSIADDTYVNVTVSTPLGAGAGQSVSKSSSDYSNPNSAPAPFSTTGNWQVRLCADTFSGGRVTESNENNNCGAWRTVAVSAAPPPPATGVDLTITAQPGIAFAETPNSRFARIAHAQTQGQASTLTATIWNFGDTATPTWYNNIFQVSRQSDFSGASTMIAASTGPSGHAPSASTNVSASWTPSASGTWYVRACADNNTSWVDRVDESNEGNNCGAARTVTVSPGAGSPSVSCSPSPSSANTGQSITWTATPSGFSGTPTYSWSAPSGSPSSGSGSSFTNSYASAGSYAATVTATLGAQSDSSSCTPVTVSVPGSCAGGPTGSLTANPDRVRSGETTTLSWSGVASVDTSCVIRNSVNGSTIPVTAPDASCSVANGSASSPTITQQTTFTLRCDGVDVDSVTVNLLPGFSEF